MEQVHGLNGIRVVERAGRLAVRLCSFLLRQAGASLTRVETALSDTGNEPRFWKDYPKFDDGVETLNLGLSDNVCGDEEPAPDIIIIGVDGNENRKSLEAQTAGIDPNRTILCVISPFGVDAEHPPSTETDELAIQAVSGLMATTGELGGEPCAVGVPVMEVFAAINAASSAVAALRARALGGGAKLIDIAVFDAAIGMFGSFLGNVANGHARGLRGGCRHPIVAPWNAYPTRDGWGVICTVSNEQWFRLLDVIGRAELRQDERFQTAKSRVENCDTVDEIVTNWSKTQTTDALILALTDRGIPAGKTATIAQLRSGPSPVPCRRKFYDTQIARSDAAPISHGKLPLAGVRIVEVGAYTAGPYAGRMLYNLGADVIKVEPLVGEVSRAWTPRVGNSSVFFANYNAGKKSVALDLKTQPGRESFKTLLGGADVVLQNLKAGAMNDLGLGPGELFSDTALKVYCNVVGFSGELQDRPAFDTVIQAEAGIMSLIGSGTSPMKAGFSLADLLAAHLAVFEIVSALRAANESRHPVELTVSMQDALAWLTQISWASEGPVLPPHTVCRANDGWIVVRHQGQSPQSDIDFSSSTTDEALMQAAEAGMPATKIFELDEVLADEHVKARQLLMEESDGDRLLKYMTAAPFGFDKNSIRYGDQVSEVGADNDAYLSR